MSAVRTLKECPKCHKMMEEGEDRLVCPDCGNTVPSKALRHKYLERNKPLIIKDLDTLSWDQVSKKWGIPGGTFSGLLRRWKYKPPAHPRVPLAPAADGRMPALPEFSTEWTPEVQKAWLDVYLVMKGGKPCQTISQ